MFPTNLMTINPLESYFPDFDSGGGIFVKLSTLDIPCIPDEDTAQSLDLEYFTNISSSKAASLLVRHFANTDGIIPDSKILSLANAIKSRYSRKWDKLWNDLISTVPILSNVDMSSQLDYGKTSTLSGTDSITKSGTETRGYTGDEQRDETFPENRKTTRQITGGWKDTHGLTNTRKGTESIEESFPTARKSSKEVTGGWKDTDTTATTRTGTESITESFPIPRSSTKGVSGGWKDADTTSTTRTGSETTTDKGDTQTSTFGFNSTTSVPASVTGPANASTGLTSETAYSNVKDTRAGDITRQYQSYSETTTESGSTKRETTFGENGLKDARSGDTTRQYQSYKEDTTETGSKRVETSYGATGLVDEESGDTSRTYDSYKDETTESGSKRVKTSFNNRTDTLSYNNRADTTEYGKVDSLSGTDTTIQTGMNIRRLADKVDVLSLLYTSKDVYNFYSVVFADVDEVLTSPFYVPDGCLVN